VLRSIAQLQFVAGWVEASDSLLLPIDAGGLFKEISLSLDDILVLVFHLGLRCVTMDTACDDSVRRLVMMLSLRVKHRDVIGMYVAGAGKLGDN